MSTQPTRRALLSAAGAGFAGIALAACAGSSKKVDASATTPTGSSSAAGAAGSGGSAAAPTLTFYGGGTGSFTDNFNPFSSTFNNGAKGMVYETLMFFNQLKAGDIEPWLAKKYTLSADGKTVTFDLQPGVTWSDGKPFTADDVVFTFELLKKTPALNTNGLKISGVKATDPHTVVLTMGQAAYTDIWYIAGLTPIVARHTWSTKSAPATDTDTKPVGTGVFTVSSFTPQSYLLAANNTAYWGGKIGIAGVRFVNYSGNTAALAGLVAGEVDWASAFIPEVDKQFVSKDPAYHANLLPATGTTYLLPNLMKYPTSEVAVRQAMQYALDLKTINTQAFSDVNLLPSSAYVITPRDDAYVAAVHKGTPAFDASKATSTLEAAGYTKGSDGIYQKAGKRVSMTVQVVTGYADYISALQLMQEQFKAVGIELNVQQDALAAFGVARAQGTFDLLIDAVYGGPGPFYAYNALFNSTLSAPIGKTAAANFIRYSNPKVDALLGQLGTTDQKDDATVKKLCGQIQAVVVPDVPYIGVAQRVDMSEYSTKKAVGYPSRTDQYAFSNVWANPDIGIVTRRLKHV